MSPNDGLRVKTYFFKEDFEMKLKKVIASVMAGTMVLGAMVTSAFAADIPYYGSDAGKLIDADTTVTDAFELTFTVSGLTSATKATLGFADGSWSYQDWDSIVDVPSDGTYTIKAKTSEEAGAEIADGIMVLVVDFNEIEADAFKITDTNYVISDVQYNGEAVSFIYGDLEEKGNLRFEIYNEYGMTKDGAAFTSMPTDDRTPAAAAEDSETGDASNAVIWLTVAAAGLGAAAIATKKYAFER